MIELRKNLWEVEGGLKEMIFNIMWRKIFLKEGMVYK